MVKGSIGKDVKFAHDIVCRYCIHSCVEVAGQRATRPLQSAPQGNKFTGVGNGSYSIYTEEILPGFPASEPITHSTLID